MRRLRRFSLLVLSSVLISALLVTSFPILGASIDPGGSGSATSVVYADDYGELAGTVVIHNASAGTVSGVYYGELTRFTTLHVTSINSDIVLQTHYQILRENRDEWGQVVATAFKFGPGFGSPAIPPGQWRVCVRRGDVYSPCSRVFTVRSGGTDVPDKTVVDEPAAKPEIQETSWDLDLPKGKIYGVTGEVKGGSFGEQRPTGEETEVWAPGDFELDDLEKIELILSDVKFQLDNPNPNLSQQKRNELAQHYHNLLQAKANVQSHDLYTSAWQDTAIVFADKTISYHPIIGGGYSVVKASLQLAMGKYSDAAMTLAGAIPWYNAGTRLSLALDYWTIIHTADTALYPYEEDITYFKPPTVYIPQDGYGGYGLR